jgi:predicted kinase
MLRLSIDKVLQGRHGVVGTDYHPHEHLALLAAVVDDVRQQLIDALRSGHSVVLDHGLGLRREREDFKRLAEGLGATWRLLHFTADRAELLRRLAVRSAGGEAVPVDADTLDWMASVTEEPHGEGEEVINTTSRVS